jgi:gentisate 1,2-dioxygenase
MAALVTSEPMSACAPVHWAYLKIRHPLFEAAELIFAERAERRVLGLENPGICDLHTRYGTFPFRCSVVPSIRNQTF